MKHQKLVICVIAGIVILAGVALGVQSAYKAGFSNPDEAGKEARWNDLRVFYGAGRWAFENIDLYKNPTSPEGRYYIFPPFFAIVCAPFAAMGWKAFVVIWFVVSFAGIVAAALLCVRIARLKAAGAGLAGLALLALFLSSRPIISDFQNGQVNSLIFLTVALSLYLFIRKHYGADGVVMALAASIKMTAGIFLLYFLFKGAYKSAAGMLLGLLFTLLLLPLAAFGPTRTCEMYSSFYDKMVSPFTSVSDAPEVYAEAGQSLRAAAGRYLTDTNAAHHADYEIRVNFTSLSAGTVWKIVLAGCVLLLLATAYCARANPADDSRRDLTALELGAVLLLMLMVSPMSRKAHFVVLVLPYIAAVNYLLLYRSDPHRRGPWKLVLIVAASTFAIFNLTSPDVLGKSISVYLLALSSFFFATLAFWLASCITILMERRTSSPRRLANSDT